MKYVGTFIIFVVSLVVTFILTINSLSDYLYGSGEFNQNSLISFVITLIFFVLLVYINTKPNTLK